MPKIKKMEFGILNIKMHPHKPEMYSEMMQRLFDIGRLVKIRGDDWGAPFFCRQIDPTTQDEGVYGTFVRFLQIDPRKAWLDIRKRQPILDEEGNPIPQVSSDLKPNMREVEFTFYPKAHLFFFNSAMITPSMIQKMLSNLCIDPKITREFGKIDVEIVSSSEIIQKILQIPALTRLEMYITRPNGDVLSGKKKKLLDRMEKQGVRKLSEVATSVKSEGIQPDDDTIAFMELATTNGKVNAVGYDGDTRVVESTVPHPQIERTVYDEENQTVLSALVDSSLSMVDEIAARG